MIEVTHLMALLLAASLCLAPSPAQAGSHLVTVDKTNAAALAFIEAVGAPVSAETNLRVAVMIEDSDLVVLTSIDPTYVVQKSYGVDPAFRRAMAAATLSNGELILDVESDGAFSLRRQSDGAWLLYPSPGTGYLTVRVDGTEYAYGSLTGASSMVVMDPLTVSDARASVTLETPEGIRVFQTLSLEGGALRIIVGLSNEDVSPHRVELRHLLDTQIDDNDGSPLYTATLGTRTVETDVLAPAFTKWEAWLTPTSPAIAGKGYLSEVPDRVVFAWWPSAFNFYYDYTANPTQSFYTPGFVTSPESDSCVLIYKDCGVVAGQSSHPGFTTTYGIAEPSTQNDGADVRVAIAELIDAFDSYALATTELQARKATAAFDVLIQDVELKEFFVEVLLDVLSTGGVSRAVGRTVNRGLLRGTQEGLEHLLKSLVESGLAEVVSPMLNALAAGIDPSWDPQTRYLHIYQKLRGIDGWELDTIPGTDYYLIALRAELESIAGTIPDELPETIDGPAIVIALRRITSKLRAHMPPSVSKGREGIVYWSVPGSCTFEGEPLNPFIVGASNEAYGILDFALNAIGVEETVSTYRRRICIGWTVGVAVPKIMVTATGVGAIPAEAIYWKGVGLCEATSNALLVTELVTRAGVAFSLLEATAAAASDIMLVGDVLRDVVDGVGESVAAAVGNSPYDVCSTDLSLVSFGIEDMQVEWFAGLASGQVDIGFANDSLTLWGSVAPFVTVYAGDEGSGERSIVGVFGGAPIAIPPASSALVQIPMEMPSNGIFGSDHYTAELTAISSGNTLASVEQFSVCGPIACWFADTVDLADGLLNQGDDVTTAFTPTSGSVTSSVTMSYSGSDLDLHVYDAAGRHVGVDYQTGTVEMRIPGATYTGSDSKPETITVPVSAGEYTARVVAVSTEGPTTYALLQRDVPVRPAILSAHPESIALNGRTGDSVSTRVTLMETGFQVGATVTAGVVADLQGNHFVLPADQIHFDEPSFSIAASEETDVRISVDLAGVEPDVFHGTIRFVPDGASAIDLPLRIEVDAPASDCAKFEVAFGDSWDGLSLQEILDAQYGAGVVDVPTGYEGYACGDAETPYWFDDAVDAWIVREIADSAHLNILGWYTEDFSMPAIDGIDDGVIFEGEDGAGSARFVDLGGSRRFGLYLNPNGTQDAVNAPEPELFFTNRRYNDVGTDGIDALHPPLTGGDPQALIYNVTHLRGGVPTYVVAWEDIDSGSPLHPTWRSGYTDNDYNDLVIEIRASSPVSVAMVDILEVSTRDVGVHLTWMLQGAAVADRFVVERQATGEDFVEIAAIDVAGVVAEFIDTSVTKPGTYSYRVVAIIDGSRITSSEQIVEVSTPVVHETRLVRARPNPFNPVTTIEYAIARKDFVEMRIYDLKGRLLRTMELGEQPAGAHEVMWNGQDDAGRTVASGVYLVKLITSDTEDALRVVLLK